MDRIEAMKLLQEIKHYLTEGNPVWDVDEIAEALDMAIEALRNEINCVKCEHYTEEETPTGIKGVCKMDTAHREDLIRIQMAIEHWGRSSGNLTNDQIAELQREIESLPSAETPTVSEKHQLSEETPRTGKWIFDDEYGYYKCSECEALAEINSVTGDYCLSMYCQDCGAKMQNCGADMRGEEE